MKFKPSQATEDFIENVHQRVGARNKAILARSAFCLALAEGVPPAFKPTDSQGKDLDDETVLGEDLRDVIRAALNDRAGKELDEGGYRQSFRNHFEYGCRRLKDVWEASGNDPTRFISSLLILCNTDSAGASAQTTEALPIVESAVKLKVLEGEGEWTINEAGHNSLVVISGKPGTGKSQLALDLLAQVARQGVRVAFFDLKGELEDDPSNPQQRESRRKFIEVTKARYLRLIQHGLPINPLIHEPSPTVNAKEAYAVASMIRAFAPQLGAKQEQAIADAYQHLDAPDFPSLANELEQGGAKGVEVALIKKIVDLNLFATAKTGIPAEDWLNSSLIIDFKEFGNDNNTKSLAVALILNFLMKRLNKNLSVKGKIQPLKMILFVDEAHLLLPKESKAGLLGSLARQGRSWGFPLWLASQDADAFITTGSNATNFAELATCGVHFSPETLNESEQRQILGGVLHHPLKQGEAAVRLHNKLRSGNARQFWRDGGVAGR